MAALWCTTAFLIVLALTVVNTESNSTTITTRTTATTV
jgi:hypothetical protein